MSGALTLLGGSHMEGTEVIFAIVIRELLPLVWPAALIAVPLGVVFVFSESDAFSSDWRDWTQVVGTVARRAVVVAVVVLR